MGVNTDFYPAPDHLLHCSRQNRVFFRMTIVGGARLTGAATILPCDGRTSVCCEKYIDFTDKKSSVLWQEYSSAGNFSIEDKKIHPGRPEHVSVSMAYRAKQIKLCLIFLIEGINTKIRNKKE